MFCHSCVGCRQEKRGSDCEHGVILNVVITLSYMYRLLEQALSMGMERIGCFASLRDSVKTWVNDDESA